ncbi:hypothetical protein M5689_020148 [Euphorbia peplus]|nr:hypothetical protein M5689_020148 [Euphorbia peplus]
MNWSYFSFLLSYGEVIDFFCSIFRRIDCLEKMEDIAHELELKNERLKAIRGDLGRPGKGDDMIQSSAISQWISAADVKNSVVLLL